MSSSESEEQQKHYAMPRLMGQPAYIGRRHVEAAPRPVDPDDLPLEAERTQEEQELAAALAVNSARPARSHREHVAQAAPPSPAPQVRPAPDLPPAGDGGGARFLRLSFGFRRG